MGVVNFLESQSPPYWYQTSDRSFLSIPQSIPRTICPIIGLVVLVISAPIHCYRLDVDRRTRVSWSWAFTYRLSCCAAIFAEQLVVCVANLVVHAWWLQGSIKVPDALLLDSGVLLMTYMLLFALLIVEKQYSVRNSGPQVCYWLFEFSSVTFSLVIFIGARATCPIASTSRMRVMMTYQVTHWVMTCCNMIGALLLDTEPKYSRVSPEPLPANKLRFENTTFLSKVVFLWFDKYIWIAWNRNLVFEDMPVLPDSFGAEVVARKFCVQMEREFAEDEFGDRKQVTPWLLYKVLLFKTFGKDLFVAMFLRLGSDILQFSGPILLAFLINYVQKPAIPTWKGVFACLTLTLALCLTSLLKMQYHEKSNTTGLFIRSALIHYVYQKALKTVPGKSAASIISVLRMDCERFFQLNLNIHMLWSNPFTISICMYLLYTQLKLAAFVSLVTFISLIGINALVLHHCNIYHERQRRIKEDKLVLIKEVIKSIKIIKFLVLEAAFQSNISEERKNELKNIIKIQLAWVFSLTSLELAPSLAGILTITGYFVIYPEATLDATQMFVSFTIMNLLKVPLFAISTVITSVQSANISAKRISEFLNGKEVEKRRICNTDRIKLENCHFEHWNVSPGKDFRLSDITLDLEPGTLVGVIGSVKAGKSSLLSALAGELRHLNPEDSICEVTDEVSLAAQTPWVMSSSIQFNIALDTHISDLDRYREVLYSCGLFPDLTSLEQGDRTIIREVSNFSGGQLKRVNLARACYRRARVYLLDDPLASLDPVFARHVFEKVVSSRGILNDGIRIVVTNELRYLKDFDKLIYLENGRIISKGSYEEIVNSCDKFRDFVSSHQFDNTDERDVDAWLPGCFGKPEGIENKEQDGSISFRFISSKQRKMALQIQNQRFAKIVNSNNNLVASRGELRLNQQLAHPRNRRLSLIPTSPMSPGPVDSEEPLVPRRKSSTTSRKSRFSFGGDPDEPETGEPRKRNITLTSSTSDNSFGTGSSNVLDNSVTHINKVATTKIDEEPLQENGCLHDSIIDIGCNEQAQKNKRVSIANGGPRPSLIESEPDVRIELKEVKHHANVSVGSQKSLVDKNWLASTARWIRAGGLWWFGWWQVMSVVYVGLDICAALQLKQWAMADVHLSNTTTNQQLRDTNMHYLFTYTSFKLGNVGVTVIRSLLQVKLSYEASLRFNDKILKAFLGAKLSKFQATPTEVIQQRFMNDMDSIDAIGFNVMMSFSTLYQLLAVNIIIALNIPWFALVVLFMLIIYIFIERFYARTKKQLTKIKIDTERQLIAQYDQTAQGLIAMRTFDMQDVCMEILHKRVNNEVAVTYLIHVAHKWLLLRLDSLCIMMMSFISIFCVLRRDSLNVGTVGLVMNTSFQINFLLDSLVIVLGIVEAQTVSIEQVREFARLEPEDDPFWDPNYEDNLEKYGQITLKKVSAKYDREAKDLVLRDVSLDIKPREKVGVVGCTGSGKSSLFMALFRLLDLEPGSHIYIDGKDISLLPLAELRKRLTIIPQTITLFKGSLLYNLDPLDDYDPQSQIMPVLHRVGILHWPELEGKSAEDLDFVNCDSFKSEGQKQMISLARGLLRTQKTKNETIKGDYKKSKVVLLDEVTAQVDMATEHVIERVLDEQFADCTVLKIAHRLNTVVHCDRILVLDKGRCVEFDRPAALLANPDSLFSQLYQANQTG